MIYKKNTEEQAFINFKDGVDTKINKTKSQWFEYQ